jgi:hypothetical protein
MLLQELHRVLKREGRLIIGFINRNSELGRMYERRKEASMFYRDARFYSVAEVGDWVKEAGFGSLRFCETLFGGPTEFTARGLEVREGYSDGAFVVLCTRNT